MRRAEPKSPCWRAVTGCRTRVDSIVGNGPEFRFTVPVPVGTPTRYARVVKEAAHLIDDIKLNGSQR